MPRTASIPRLQILAAAALFSTGGAAIKACDLTSWQVAGLRSGIAALALFAVFPAWRRILRPRVLLVGAAYAATMLLFVLGNKLTTAANTIFLQATAPVYLLALGPWLLAERTTRAQWILTSAIAAGMVLFFVGTEPPQVTAPDPFLGNVLGGCAGLTWALTILGLRWLGREAEGGPPGGDTATVGQAVIAGNVLAALFAAPMAFPLQNWDAGDLAIVGYLGLFQIGLAYVCLTYGVRRLAALETSLLLLLEPVLSVIWAWLLHGERPGPWSLAGCALILSASVARAFVARGRSRRGRSASPRGDDPGGVRPIA